MALDKLFIDMFYIINMNLGQAGLSFDMNPFFQLRNELWIVSWTRVKYLPWRCIKCVRQVNIWRGGVQGTFSAETVIIHGWNSAQMKKIITSSEAQGRNGVLGREPGGKYSWQGMNSEVKNLFWQLAFWLPDMGQIGHNQLRWKMALRPRSRWLW